MADRIPLVVDSSSQQIKELPTGDSLILSDNEKLIFGTSSDLEIYHDGSNSIIKDAGTGGLYIRASANLQLQDADGYLYVNCIDGGNGGTTKLYNLNQEKLATTSTGIDVTGKVVASTSAAITQVALTSTSNAVAWDSTAAANAYHLLTENTTFAAPSNAVEGAIISVEIAQGGTPYTVAWNTVFEFAASTAPTVTATANKTDIFSFRYNGSVWQEIGRVQNLAQT
jgi:hypothetical protein